MLLDSIRDDAPQAAGDALASTEEANLLNDRKRDNSLKQNLHRVFVGFLWVAAFSFFIVLIIRIYHLIAPGGWCWIDERGIQGIDKLIFSGTIGGFVGRYFKRAER